MDAETGANLGVAFGSDNRSSKACAAKISNQAIFSKLTQKHANDTQCGMCARFYGDVMNVAVL